MKGQALDNGGMIWLVIGINLGISWGCWRLVGILIGLRKTMVGVTRAIEGADRATHNLLAGAPDAILLGHTGARSLRRHIPGLAQYLSKVRQVLTVALWLQRQLKLLQSKTRGNRPA
ncbi:hypothetical protein [Synechococcus sp. C9]|uniref:hypothetical protein n=1 Tax=Synechococcus sp. C9 TaxID=102119 RepID=UPI001FF31E63|nr:hypothetical protein [Synechococcus sp. C9]